MKIGLVNFVNWRVYVCWLTIQWILTQSCGYRPIHQTAGFLKWQKDECFDSRRRKFPPILILSFRFFIASIWYFLRAIESEVPTTNSLSSGFSNRFSTTDNGGCAANAYGLGLFCVFIFLLVHNRSSNAAQPFEEEASVNQLNHNDSTASFFSSRLLLPGKIRGQRDF